MSGLNVKFDCSNAAQHNLLSKLFCIEFRKERLNREQWGLESVGGGLFDQTKRGVFSFEGQWIWDVHYRQIYGDIRLLNPMLKKIATKFLKPMCYERL